MIPADGVLDAEAKGGVMDRRAVLVCALTAAQLVTGCASPGPSGSTAPRATEQSTVEASAAGGPTPVPGAVTAPPAGSGPLEVTAVNIAFEPVKLVAPAGPLVLRFHNQDAAIPHTVAIMDASGGQLFQGEIVTGPSDIDYAIPDLAPGSYTFMCTVHPNMTGTLTVVP
jgi:plastocyanin